MLLRLIRAMTGLAAIVRWRGRDIRTVAYGSGRFRRWGDWRDTGLIWQVFDLERSARYKGIIGWHRHIVSVLCSRPPRAGDRIRFRCGRGEVRARVRSADGRDLVKSLYVDEGIADAIGGRQSC